MKQSLGSEIKEKLEEINQLVKKGKLRLATQEIEKLKEVLREAGY